MTATVVPCVPAFARVRDRRSASYRTALGGTVCYVTMLGVTFAGNIQINRRVLAASPEAPPDDWYALRRRWDRWRTLRNGLNVLGFGLLITSALVQRRGERDAIAGSRAGD